MRKILIIAQGIVAKEVLDTISQSFYAKNEYHVIMPDDSILLEPIPEHFKTYHFDPTSLMRLSEVLRIMMDEAFIILKDRKELVTVYNNIRELRKQMPITVLDHFGLDIEDKNLIRVDGNGILSNRMVLRLPDVPITAQNIGLGLGEIMEVSVPFSSSYVYRYIGNIEQKNWKIVGIYRSDKLLIAKDSLFIQPNDSLLIIGDPDVLRNVYQAIKRELGQFPAPFGSNLYLYLDMKLLPSQEIHTQLDTALFLHSQLKSKKLFIRIVNPCNIELLNHIKEFDEKNVSVQIAYRKSDFEEIIRTDYRRFGTGMLLLGKKLFDEPNHKLILKKLGRPVLRLTNDQLVETKKCLVLLTKQETMEKISPVVYDVSSQLGMYVEIYSNDSEKEEELINHYENLARIYNVEMKTLHLHNENPLRKLSHSESYLQMLPLNDEVCRSKTGWFLSTNTERLYFKHKHANQLFIPV